jgi:hypothetical protein
MRQHGSIQVTGKVLDAVRTCLFGGAVGPQFICIHASPDHYRSDMIGEAPDRIQTAETDQIGWNKTAMARHLERHFSVGLSRPIYILLLLCQGYNPRDRPSKRRVSERSKNSRRVAEYRLRGGRRSAVRAQGKYQQTLGTPAPGPGVSPKQPRPRVW